MKILLIAGGWSSERPVSLAGARQIEQSLKKLGHTVTVYDPEYSLTGLLSHAKEHDFAYIALHGQPGEDGLIQAMLDCIGCPYQGSDASASFVALNKAAAKEMFIFHNIPTAAYSFLQQAPQKGWQPEWLTANAWPLFVKSNTGGSSLDLYRVENGTELDSALEKLFAKGHEVIIEPFIAGMEVTCGVLTDETGVTQPLPPILIAPASHLSFFDYTAKYTPGAASEICPAPISAALTRQIQALALKAHDTLGLYGYSRSDFMVTKDEQPYILEVNTLPGMTPTSLVPQEAAAIGLSFEDLLARLIHSGLQRHSRVSSAQKNCTQASDQKSDLTSDQS